MFFSFGISQAARFCVPSCVKKLTAKKKHEHNSLRLFLSFNFQANTQGVVDATPQGKT